MIIRLILQVNKMIERQLVTKRTKHVCCTNGRAGGEEKEVDYLSG